MISVYVLGMGTVGKSSLTLRLVNDIFVESYDPTIEDSYQKYFTIDHIREKIEIYDTAGQDEYRTMRDQWSISGDAFVVVYSVASQLSFEEVEVRIQELKQIRTEHLLPLVIVGNKCDLEQEREVLYEEGKSIAEKWDCPFFETSAKNDINVDKAFYEVIREVRKMKNTNRLIANRRSRPTCRIL